MNGQTLIQTGLTQLSQVTAQLRRAERQMTRLKTWEHQDVLIAAFYST
ncbi:MAG: hypothetical protein V7K40_33715 [Nostoc sp.]